jgi:hypothetical protein
MILSFELESVWFSKAQLSAQASALEVSGVEGVGVVPFA